VVLFAFNPVRNEATNFFCPSPVLSYFEQYIEKSYTINGSETCCVFCAYHENLRNDDSFPFIPDTLKYRIRQDLDVFDKYQEQIVTRRIAKCDDCSTPRCLQCGFQKRRVSSTFIPLSMELEANAFLIIRDWSNLLHRWYVLEYPC
jgi:hypothetical protein